MFEWKEKYSTGIEKIDIQHKGLIDLINKLFAAMQSGAGKDLLGATLSGLIDYTKMHFLTEEMLMENYDYPGLAEHQLAHQALTEEVLKFEEEFNAGNTGITIQLLTFLRSWLDNHICQVDHQYSTYLTGKGLR